MTQSFRQDELDKLPEDEIDYKDFILQVASNNSWVFDRDKYINSIVNTPKVSLRLVDNTLKELCVDNFLIKQSGRRTYSVTTKGRQYHKTGKLPKETTNQTHINAQQVVFAGGDISAPISQANDHNLSAISNNAAIIRNKQPIIKQPIIKRVIKFVFWFVGGIISLYSLYELIKLLIKPNV
jgi:hypothetical protein